MAQWRDREEHPLAGKLRALAATGTKRLPVLPDLPTVVETGVAGYDAAGLLGIVAPAGTPADMVTLLNQEINRALARPEIVERYAKEGSAIVTGSPAEFAAFLKQNRERWAKVITTGNIRAE